MGEYLSTPNKEKKTEEAENGRVNFLEFLRYVIVQIRSSRNVGLEKIDGRYAYR